jgi:8-oxo-dGTP pyrophosphatase MutT (NUDIX family)
MQNPERLGSRVAFENCWVRLLLDRLRLGDGMEIDYTYIARPRYAIAAAVEDGRIWMVEQYRHPLGRRSWELPMGVAPGVPEDRMDEAAAVELREETGVRAARFDYVGEVAPAPALLAQTGALYFATGLTQGATDREATEQDLVAEAWPVADVLAAASDGRIVDAATLASLGLLRLKGLI